MEQCDVNFLLKEISHTLDGNRTQASRFQAGVLTAGPLLLHKFHYFHYLIQCSLWVYKVSIQLINWFWCCARTLVVHFNIVHNASDQLGHSMKLKLLPKFFSMYCIGVWSLNKTHSSILELWSRQQKTYEQRIKHQHRYMSPIITWRFKNTHVLVCVNLHTSTGKQIDKQVQNNIVKTG